MKSERATDWGTILPKHPCTGFLSSHCENQSILLAALKTLSTKIPEGHDREVDKIFDCMLAIA